MERSSWRLCSSPMSKSRWSNTPAWLSSRIGTSIPHCSMYWVRATVLRHTDLPPAFGPLSTSSRFASSPPKRSDIGTTVRPSCSKRSCSTAWRASRQSSIGRRCSWGAMALNRMATCALARTKSTCANCRYSASMAGDTGRICSVTDSRMRVFSRFSSDSKERMRLLASTTSCGSTKMVLPEALSSWTMPPILRRLIGGTGSTNRPSRKVGVVSLSTHPSLCACRKTDCIARATEPCARFSSWRMRASSGEALSLSCP